MTDGGRIDLLEVTPKKPTTASPAAVVVIEGVLTHTTLLREVWGRGYGSEAHYLHVYVSQLRRKLEPDPARPRYILTEPGAGYRLAEPVRSV